MKEWADLLNAAVRPFAAIAVIGSLCAAFMWQVFGGPLDVKDAFIGVGGGVLGWYFGKREGEKAGEVQATQVAEKAAVKAVEMTRAVDASKETQA